MEEATNGKGLLWSQQQEQWIAENKLDLSFKADGTEKANILSSTFNFFIKNSLKLP